MICAQYIIVKTKIKVFFLNFTGGIRIFLKMLIPAFEAKAVGLRKLHFFADF